MSAHNESCATTDQWRDQRDRADRAEAALESARTEAAKVILDALADRLDFWDGRPWEGETSTNDILDYCERAAARLNQVEE